MKINRNNYESFFLDYIEGKLSKEFLAEVEVFISKNPDLKEELESFDNLGLKAEKSEFGEKNSLFKSEAKTPEISEQNIDEYCIAKIEGDLNSAQVKSFNAYIKQHADARNLFSQYKNTNLSFDRNIRFTTKDNLIKNIYDSSVTEISFDDFCIAYIEKQLNTKQTETFLAFINKHPKKRETLNMYKQILLKADKDLMYPYKKELIKKSVFKLNPQVFLKYSSIAAAILIAFLVVFNYKDLLKTPVDQIAKLENNTKNIDAELADKVQIASSINDGDKTKTISKEKIKKGTNKILESKTDTSRLKRNKLRKLKPLIINTGRTFQFTIQESTPNIIGNYNTLAKLDFNYNVKPDMPSVPKPKKEYITLNEFVADRFRKAVLGNHYKEDREITYLDIAQVGISGINKITPGKIDFEQKTNKDGELEYLAVNTKFFAYAKNFKR